MNAFTSAVLQVFHGAGRAMQKFPAAIACALAFAIVTMIRIHLDWPEQEAYNFLFNCLHWSFALGAVFSLAAITAAQSRINRSGAFMAANLLGAAAAVITFLALYLFGGTEPDLVGARFSTVSVLAATRVSTAILVSVIAFVIVAGYPKDQSDLARSFFMTQKAFFIAVIYGMVITGGASGVAGAVQALLYRGMSEKVYMYIATLAGFFAFTIFSGYFPDFRKGQVDEHRLNAQKQPRFVEILFEYIMIPLMLALTVVLLLWTGKSALNGMKVSFLQLSGIATGYAAIGIWLHIMVTHYKTGLAKFYRRFYPFSTLVILIFEAWALINQLTKSGLKTAEYSFALIWLLAVAAAILLIIFKDRAHTAIAVLTCALAVFSVLPAVGYHSLPVTFQTNRLEKLLVSQNMLEGGRLISAAVMPDLAVRRSVTDAVNFLANTQDVKLPDWFDKRLRESDVFKAKLGFEQAWPEPDAIIGQGSGEYMGTNLVLEPGVVDISDYRWAIALQQEKENSSVTFNGSKGIYEADWSMNRPAGVPSLKITLNDRVVLQQDMNKYIDRISAKFLPGKGQPTRATLEDMSLKLESPEIQVLLVFENVSINVNTREDTISYWFILRGLYVREKP